MKFRIIKVLDRYYPQRYGKLYPSHDIDKWRCYTDKSGDDMYFMFEPEAKEYIIYTEKIDKEIVDEFNI